MRNTKRPVVGVTMAYDKNGLVRAGVNYSMIRQEYGEQLKAAGASPIFIDSTIDPQVAAELCDGILISGGEDIDPRFYGQKASHIKILEPPERTEWEHELIDACDARSVKILGICYGSQLLNVHYGGTLYQDIEAEAHSELCHGSTDKALLHKITFVDDFLGFSAEKEIMSASRHHQAVRKLGKGMRVTAYADDGIIEAVAGNGHHGVQWHAEVDGTSSTIYGSFVSLISKPVLDTNEGFQGEHVFRPGIA